MEFNSLIFPAPNFDFHTVNQFKNELIFVPSNNPKNKYYIPCLFLSNEKSRTSKNFIIFFHGNAEDIFLASSMATPLLEELNMNIIIVEYPGYSIYKGEATAERILENTSIGYDFIQQKFNLEEKNMYVYGRSIGSSPAIYLASIRKPNALFIVSSFTSIRAVAGNMVGPLKYLVKDRFFSKNYIKEVRCPVMFIHGKSDPLIPYTETLELIEECKSEKNKNLPEYMTHNDFNLYKDIIEPISTFVKEKCVVDYEKKNYDENEIEKLRKMPEEIKLYIKNNLK